MKNKFLALSIALITFVSCSKDDTPTVETTVETYINATSKTTWNYYSFAENRLIGTGEETTEDNDKWYARNDWDIAINRYYVRTNSGVSIQNGNGGLYICSPSVTFNSLNDLPSDLSFTADKAIISSGMGGETTSIIRSEATVIIFKTNDDGSMIMPPVYLQAPVYIFRTADSNDHYKVQFTQYLDENKISGHVKFNSALIKN